MKNKVTPFFVGLWITIKHFFNPHKFTYQYPEEPKPVYPRSRWLHKLQRYDDGKERCIACMLCAASCPPEAIYIEAEENPPDNPYTHGERYAKVWDLDLGRCIFCGNCVEACPEEALIMTQKYELSVYNRKDLILHKDDLLAKIDEKPRVAWQGNYPEKIPDKPLEHKDYDPLKKVEKPVTIKKGVVIKYRAHNFK